MRHAALDARAAADEVEPLRGQTAQHAAAAAEPAVAPALLERLLAAGGALHADREGFTALHVAAGRGCVAALQLLIERAPDAELGRLSSTNVTPLAAACRRDQREAARLLRAAGAPLDAGALHLCAAKGRTELLDALLDGASDGDVDCAGDDGETALMRAAADGDESAVGALLAKRADPNAFDRDRHTALMRAAFHGHAKVIGLLCAGGAAVDAVDATGCSALHHAGRGSQEFAFDVLELKHGADSTLRNAKGEVPEVQEEPCRVQ